MACKGAFTSCLLQIALSIYGLEIAAAAVSSCKSAVESQA